MSLPPRYADIEVGDRLTFLVIEGWRWPTDAEIASGADKSKSVWARFRQPIQASARVLESVGDGWRVAYGLTPETRFIVTPETFVALRKANGKGGSRPAGAEGADECQVCARFDLKLVDGLISYHGYRRPYIGGQTPECLGSRQPPYSESRDILPEAIRLVDAEIAHRREIIERIDAGVEPIPDRLGREDSSGRPLLVLPTDEGYAKASAAYRSLIAYPLQKSLPDERAIYVLRYETWARGIRARKT